MRTTISLEDELLALARQKALEKKISLARLIEMALREKLLEDVRESDHPYVPLRTFRGNGVQPGVDLNDSADLLSRVEVKE